jgi:hypothetical protein
MYINTIWHTFFYLTSVLYKKICIYSQTCGVRVTRSLVLCLCFVDRCLSFCPFSFGHCVVCFSSIYGFWLPLWYLQTLIKWPSKVEGNIDIWSHKTGSLCFNFFTYKMYLSAKFIQTNSFIIFTCPNLALLVPNFGHVG